MIASVRLFAIIALIVVVLSAYHVGGALVVAFCGGLVCLVDLVSSAAAHRG